MSIRQAVRKTAFRIGLCYCGASFYQRPGPGRPREYCSDRCKDRVARAAKSLRLAR